MFKVGDTVRITDEWAGHPSRLQYLARGPERQDLGTLIALAEEEEGPGCWRVYWWRLGEDLIHETWLEKVTPDV
jgi:hypothetical protein